MFTAALIATFGGLWLAWMYAFISDRHPMITISFLLSSVAWALFIVFWVSDNERVHGHLNCYVDDFDTAPVCYRHEPDVVCCGRAGQMTCMIDRRDP